MRSEGAEGSSSTSDCDDPLVVIACAAESDACPAACREEDNKEPEVIKSGDLIVTAAAATNRSALKNGKISDLDTLTFKTSEEVTISKVILERYGYSSADDIAAVWLENEDGKIISNKAETATKGQYKLTIDKDYRKVDGTASATIVLQTKNPTNGSNIGFKVVDVTSTAANVNLNDYTPYSYDFVVYNGTSISFAVRGSDRTYNYEEGESYEVAKFRVKAAEDSAALVKGFTLTDLGDLDIEDETFEDVVVTVDDKEVKTSWSVDEDKETLTVAFNEVEIPAKEYATFAVVVKLAKDFDQFSKKLNFKVNGIEDVNALEKKTGSRVSAEGDLPTMKVYTFAGGKVRLTSEKLGSVDAGINASDIKVAEGKIELSQAIKSDSTNKLEITVTLVPGTKLIAYNADVKCSKTAVKGYTKVPGTSYSDAACTSADGAEDTSHWYKYQSNDKFVKGIIDSLRVIIDGEEYTGTPDNGTTTVVYTFPSIEIEESGKVQVLFDTLEDADYEGSTMTLSMSNLDQFYYSDGKATDKIDVSGSLNFSKVTIQGASSSLTNNAKDKVQYKLDEVNRYSIFDGTFTAKKSDINLNSFVVRNAATTLTDAGDADGDGNNTEVNKVTFYLSIDGEEVADATASIVDGALVASDSFSNVLVKAGKSASVKLEAEIDAKWTQIFNTFSLGLNGEDVNGTPIKEVSRNTVSAEIVKSGTPAIEKGASRNTVLLRSANQVIAEFIVKSDNSTPIDLDSLEFKLPNAVDPDSVVLYVDGSEEDLQYDGADPRKYSIDGLTNVLDSDGVTVKVELANEVAAGFNVVSLTNLKVNTQDFSSTTFTKAFADAVLVLSQEDKGDYTLFTVQELKKYKSSVVVSNLVLNGVEAKGAVTADEKCSNTDLDGYTKGATAYTDAACSTAGAAGTYYKYTREASDAVEQWGIEGTISVGDTFEIDNDKTTVSISSIKYHVVNGGSSYDVDVSRSTYGDYFKTAGGDNYRVFSNNN